MGRTVSFELPPITSAKDAVTAMSALIDAVAAGEITPAEATLVAQLIDTAVRSLESRAVEVTMEMIEKRVVLIERRNESVAKEKTSEALGAGRSTLP
jgi:hypothetical protein